MSINLGTAFVSIIPEVQGIQGDLFSGMRGVDQAADEAGSKAGGIFSGGFGKILKGGAIVASVAALGEAAGAAFSATFGKAMEAQSATAKASAQLGLSDADAQGLGKSAGRLYAQAYGESLGDVTESLAVVKSSLKGLGADELEGATKKALSFSEAFDVDMARSVQTVSTLMGSGLATNADQAFDLITRASQKVPAALREDVLDASDEYSQFFSALGFDANEAFGALTSASDKGVFGIDKTGDAIKEFTIRATDMSASTVGAFNSIGLDAQSMANQILAGGDTAQGATQQIIDGLLAIQDPATQANTAIALFGTPLEDLGVSSVPQFLSSLDDATGGLGDFAGAAADVDSKLGGTIESKFTSATRSIGGMGSALGQGLLPLFGPVLDGITGLATKGSEKLALLEGPLTALTSGDFDPAKWAPGIMEDAPIVTGLLAIHDGAKDAAAGLGMLVSGDFDPSKWAPGIMEDSPFVMGLLAIRSAAIDVGSELGGQFMQVWKDLQPALSEVGKILGPAVVDIFTTLWEAVKPLLPTLMDLMTVFNPIGLLFKALVPLLPQIASLVGDLGKVLADGLARALQAVAPLFQAIVDVVNRLLPFITDLVASLLPPLMRLFESLVPLIEGILDALMPVVELIVASLIPVIEALMPVVERVFTFLADTIGNFVGIITGVIEVITGVFTGDWEKVWTGVKDIFGSIWDQIKNVVGTLVDLLGMVGGQLLEWVSGLPALIGGALSSFGQWMVDRGVEFLAWLATGIATKGAELGQWFSDLPGVLWGLLAQASQWVVDRGVELLTWLVSGILTKGIELAQWFADLPGVLWGRIAEASQWVVDRGFEFLVWLATGIANKGLELAEWFRQLPGVLAGKVAEAAQWMVDRGSEFLGWLLTGITTKGTEVVQWFAALPGNIWNSVKSAFEAAVVWGGNLIKSIVEGIQKAAPYVGKAVLDAVSAVGEWLPGFNLAGAAASSVSGDIDALIAQMEAEARDAGLPAYLDRRGPGRARGGLIPGIDPGRGIDNILTPMRSGEAVMVPEWASLVGGERAVHAMNRAAERGVLVGPGFAAGGVIGAQFQLVGANIIKAIIPSLVGAAQGAVQQATGGGTSSAAGFTDSQDPSSFGWQRAANIVPYSWNGYSFAGGVAAGTQGLWNALLNELVPQIPGGLIPGQLFGFQNRNNVNSPNRPSFHSYGLALDINSAVNANGLNPASIQGRTGAIPIGPANALASRLGMLWGGAFNGTKDAMHFEIHVPPSGISGVSSAPASAGPATSFLSDFATQLGTYITSKVGFGAAGAAPNPVAGGKFAPNVERWRPLAIKALAAFGYGTEWVDPMLWQITTESGGDPMALNDWDRNFPLYGGSKGLLQTIQPTFESALRGTPFANLIPKGPYDPWANLLAAVSYVQREYGGPSVWLKSVGGNPNPYDWGGWLMPGDQGINLGGRPEAVLTPVQSDAYVTHAKAIAAGGFGGQVPQLVFSFDSSDPLQVAVVQMIRNSQAELLQNVRTKAAQA